MPWPHLYHAVVVSDGAAPTAILHGRRSVGDGGGTRPPTFQLGGDHIGNVPPTFLVKKWKNLMCFVSF